MNINTNNEEAFKNGALVALNKLGYDAKLCFDFNGTYYLDFNGSQCSDSIEKAYVEFLDSQYACRACLKGYDYSKFAIDASNRANMIRGGVGHLFTPGFYVLPFNYMRVMTEKERFDFLDACTEHPYDVFQSYCRRLLYAVTACCNMLTVQDIVEAVYFETVHVLLSSIRSDKPISRWVINERLTALIKILDRNGSVDIFQSSNSLVDNETDFNLNDDKFLELVSSWKEQSFAVALLTGMIRKTMATVR